MTVVLPDTSVWVAFLRRGNATLTAELDGLLGGGQIVVCGPVLAELAAGARADDRAAVLDALGGLPWAELDRAGWLRVGAVAAALRDQRQTLALTDVEIAVAAAAADATLWTADHFRSLPDVVDGLRVRFADELPGG